MATKRLKQRIVAKEQKIEQLEAEKKRIDEELKIEYLRLEELKKQLK